MIDQIIDSNYCMNIEEYDWILCSDLHTPMREYANPERPKYAIGHYFPIEKKNPFELANLDHLNYIGKKMISISQLSSYQIDCFASIRGRIDGSQFETFNLAYELTWKLIMTFFAAWHVFWTTYQRGCRFGDIKQHR